MPLVCRRWRGTALRIEICKGGHDEVWQAHGLTHLLTFDADFNRYAAEGITITHPASVPVADEADADETGQAKA